MAKDKSVKDFRTSPDYERLSASLPNFWKEDIRRNIEEDFEPFPHRSLGPIAYGEILQWIAVVGPSQRPFTLLPTLWLNDLQMAFIYIRSFKFQVQEEVSNRIAYQESKATLPKQKN